ncbi:MAG: SUMF1/EgtB/PvdO family nonheme iron enzyme, partial [Chthoniobacteraceae bacterium]|nr:SUMF1/EgtB/PvdO family nonheme iron enzyme [Chthoniobacteraceae bacterium]
MSDQNDYFRQGMRDLATAAQLSAANEAAKNSRKLLESQKEQIALEQQKLQIEQIRLMEERAHREAAQTKAERQKAIRTAMAAMERLLQSFGRDLAAGRFNQLIAGISLGTFLGILVQKRLHNLSDVESELEDLADIRFMGTLQQSFLDLAAANKGELGSGPMKEALQKLCELAMWAGPRGGEISELGERVSSFLRKLRSGTGESNALDKILAQLRRVDDERKNSAELETVLMQLWDKADEALKALSAGGMGSDEMQFIMEVEPHPSLEAFKAKLAVVVEDLDKCEKILKAAEAAWHSDKALIEKAVGEVNAGQFAEAERTEKKMSSRDWTDFDATQVKRALEGEGDRLLAEVNALLPARKKAAAALAEKHSQAYAESVLITGALKRLHSTLVGELMAEKKLRRSMIGGVVALAVVAGFIAVPVVMEQNEKAERLEEGRIALEKGRIAAVERKAKLTVEIGASRAGATTGVWLAGEVLMPFAFCPSGAFIMGSPDNQNQVSVTLSKGFWMGKTEVTQAQWRAVMGNNPSDSKWGNLPVENVSWFDAQEFIKRLNNSGVMPSGWKF